MTSRERGTSGLPITIFVTLCVRRVGDRLVGDALTMQRDRFRPQLLARRRFASTRRRSSSFRCSVADVSMYAAIHGARNPLASRLAGARALLKADLADANEDALRRRPRRPHAIIAAEIVHLRIDALGGPPRRSSPAPADFPC